MNGAPGAGRGWRHRRGELGLIVACPLVVALSLLLWTGVVPGIYPSTPVRWTMEVPTCVHAGEATPYVEHRFPYGAELQIRWTSSLDVLFLTSGDFSLSQFGMSGNASVLSHASPVAFWPEFVGAGGVPPGCPQVLVTTVVSYTL